PIRTTPRSSLRWMRTATASSTRRSTRRTRPPARPTWKASAAKASAAARRDPLIHRERVRPAPSLPNASAGLGLRRGLLSALQAADDTAFDFLECAPENCIGVGGRLGAAFEALAERHPVTCHGLSLSLGSVAP